MDEGYRQLEYLVGTGTQYIDTGFRFDSIPKKVTVDFQYCSAMNNKWVFGFFGTNTTEAGIYSNVFYTSGKFTYSTNSVLERCTAETDFLSFTTQSDKCFLFGRNITSDIGSFRGKVYSLTIETENETIMHLVPAERIVDGVLGMYDTVSDEFFTNIGTGTFYSNENDPTNYTSIEALISAEKANMDTLINNTAYDDNAYTIANPPAWLKFNNITPSSMYASGNTWFGIGSTTEHIKFNRRDTKMYYLYREDGTVYGHFRFLKLRWRGYSVYSQTSSSYLQEWEVYFFDTGDVMIRAVTIPTSSYDGTFNIVASQTYTYTKPTVASPIVTFYSKDDNHSVFEIKYEPIVLKCWNDKWLIEDEGVFYNIVDGELNPLEITEITEQNMIAFGFDEVPDGSLLVSLTEPRVHRWNDSYKYLEEPIQPSINARLTAYPFPQTMEVVIDMSHETITGIQGVTAQYAGELTVRYSLDDGETYTEEEAVADFLNEDFTAIFEGLPESKKLFLRFIFRNDAMLTNVRFTFTN